jgi:hypothetical protein
MSYGWVERLDPVFEIKSIGTAQTVPFLLWETQSIACNFIKLS